MTDIFFNLRVKMSYYDLFLQLAKPNKKNGKSRIVQVNQFKNEFETLKLGNGGSWCRFDTSKLAKKYNIIKYYGNGKIEKNFDSEMDIQSFFEKGKGNKIIALQLCGYNTNKIFNKHIRIDIKNYYKNKNCVLCGSYHMIEVDHKNYLNNDFRLNNVKNQTFDDFQSLCKHCNDQKRTDIKKYKNSHKCPPLLSFFAQNVNAIDLKFTFWYDPIQYTKNVFKLYFLNFIEPIIYEYFKDCKNEKEFFEIGKKKIEEI